MLAKSKSPLSFLKSRPFRVDILTLVVSLLVMTVVIIVGYNYHSNTKSILEVSDDLISQVTETVIEKTTNYLSPASIMAEMSSRIAGQGALSLTDNDRLESYTIEVVRAYPQLAMFNIGDEQGNFLMPKKMSDGTIATKIINRTTTPPTVTWKYRDRTGKIIKVDTSNKVKYDPRIRPWYKGAKKSRKSYWTDMYILFTDQKPGITAAYPVVDKNGHFWGVFSLDIELDQLSLFLQTLKIGQTGVAFIINQNQEIVAYPDDISRIIKKEGESFRPIHIDELGEEWIITSFREHQKTKTNKFVTETNGQRYLSSVTPFPKSFGKEWKIVLVVPEDDFIGAIKATNRVTLLISLAILLIAIILATILSRSISRSVVFLSKETEKIKDFQLDEKIAINSHIREIQLMSNALSAMKTGLRAFKKYVPAGLVRRLIQTGEEARLGGQKRELTVFFSDIAGFTPISEGMSPEELMLHLSEYLDEITRIIMEQKGTVDKYIGDAIMAFWGAPIWETDHAFYACRAALLCQKKIQELNSQWEKTGKIPLPTRIGIHTGETIVGNMGSTERMNYSVIGDSVNLASRLEGVNKIYGTQTIVSQATYEKVADKFLFRPLDIVAVKGKKRGITIYELVDEKTDSLTPETVERCEGFAQGFKSYLKQDWDSALKIFNAIIQKFPSDRVTHLYIKRCGDFRNNPPGPGWEGVTRLETK